MDADRVELQIAALLDKADVDQARVGEAIAELKATGVNLQREVKIAAASAMQEALKALQADIEAARHVVAQLQGFSLWRAAWQHVIVAVIAMGVTVLAVWYYVPSVAEIAAMRADKAQLEASIADLTKNGAKMVVTHCGTKKRLCVAVDEAAGVYGEGREYRIAKGY